MNNTSTRFDNVIAGSKKSAVVVFDNVTSSITEGALMRLTDVRNELDSIIVIYVAFSADEEALIANKLKAVTYIDSSPNLDGFWDNPDKVCGAEPFKATMLRNGRMDIEFGWVARFKDPEFCDHRFLEVAKQIADALPAWMGYNYLANPRGTHDHIVQALVETFQHRASHQAMKAA